MSPSEAEGEATVAISSPSAERKRGLTEQGYAALFIIAPRP